MAELQLDIIPIFSCGSSITDTMTISALQFHMHFTSKLIKSVWKETSLVTEDNKGRLDLLGCKIPAF